MATESRHLPPVEAMWPPDGGAMGELIRATDWSRTPLGPVERWPQSLRTALSICLGSKFPILLWWGPEFLKLYNDAYRPMLGDKHPRSLGQPGRECWQEIWHIIGPMLEGVRARGEATWSDDQMLPLHRLGFTEECYFTYTYSPIRGDTGSVDGVFCAVIETTERVLAARRLATLRELAAHATDAHDDVVACANAVATLAATPEDTPFAAMYLLDESGAALRRVAVAGAVVDSGLLPARLCLAAPEGLLETALVAACTSRGSESFQAVDAAAAIPQPLWGRPWSEPIRTLACLPVTQPGQPHPYGVILAGISPRRGLDAPYRGFLELAAGHVATAVTNSRTLEQERRRARMLAELDRAKTTFFANVSHEFRTPLTLMLGPLEQILSAAPGPLPHNVRQDLQATYRNALRLLKLVNTLLDFSRIEAGRADVTFEPTDLGRYTGELASVFRSAVEDAGLRYTVDCPSLAESAYVDRQMWEKIVFNLLSNALKFTLEGEIAVRLAAVGDCVELSVADTGLGIARSDQARIFERFHRVTNLGARTQEGTGIGLALSQEFVRLHGGTLRVESEPDRGSVFTVSIPRGHAHLAPERVRTQGDHAIRADRGAPYIHEALGWVGSSANSNDAAESESSALLRALPAPTARVLIADDNADMRGYLRRICAERWDVELHADGASALAAIQRNPPDLVLADIMMPGLDGLTLVRRVRADPAMRELPIILLSARAGEEARLEGLQAGASDYLVKPFSARELLAYVEARLEIAAIRREAERGLHQSAMLNAIQRDTLALAVGGAPMQAVLQALADAGPRLLGDRARTAVYTNESGDGLLRFGASSGLPEAYAHEAGTIAIGAQSLPCGRAAFTGRPAIVADLAADPQCERYLPLARALDVRSCWSLPIRSAEGRVLGTYAIYHAEPGEPTSRELERLDLLTQTAAVVLEHHASARMREAAEATLRDSEQRLNAALQIANSSRREIESLLDAAPLGVYVVDADLRIRHANPTALATFGSDGDIVGRDFAVEIERLWPADYAAEVIGMLEHTLATGESHVMPERIHVRRDLGVTEFYEWQIDRIPLADGRPGVVCYYRDVSTQVRARTALARAEALNRGQKRALELALNGGAIDEVLDVLARTGYEVFRDQHPTAIFRTRLRARRASLVAFAGLADSYVRSFRESNLLEVSPSRRAILDGEMVVVEDVRTDANCAAYTEIAEAHGIRAVWSFPIRAPDGTVLGALTVYRLVPGAPEPEDVESMRLLGDTAGMLLERDRVVAARRAAEEALRESERRIRELADAMPQLVWTSDSTGRVDYYNGRALQYAGIRPGATSGADWRTMLHPDDVEETAAAWQRAVDGCLPYVCEHRLLMADGSYRWHLSRAEPVRSGEAGVEEIRWFGTATDVHELRAAREALHDNEERLREADRRKDEFIAMLAHELRNPLAPIRTGLQVIQRAPGRVREVSRLGEIMERQVTHMVRLIDDLLDVSRITSGKLVLQRQPSLLQDLVAGAVDANRSSIAAGGLELVVRVPEEPLLLDVDPTRFLQVVSNLLNNAAKFTPAGGRIELVARLEGDPEASRLVLAVSDTGIGIAPGMLQRVFEMFMQAEPTLQRSNAGLGIGLALARQLVEMHGGTLVAQSDGPGRGSTFTLQMPLGRPQVVRHAPDAVAATAPNCVRRVLIVDDNEDAAEALAMLVTDLGGAACTANDGRSSLERIVDFEPEIVLLDLGMPGMDGYETCRRMREAGSRAYIVALTGWGQQKDRHQVLRSGFDAHLTKPADPAQLEELLEQGRLGAVARPA
ncbi:MAG TPA: ATP-binding protein [Steroidobacteraceae bacterium]|nr:ATP-binding protein [Steroidobacteraceae bacterium]